MNSIQAYILRKIIEVYLDDTVMKTGKGMIKLDDLQDLFSKVAKYKIRLNPAKCTFGVYSGNLLGHMMTHRGIEDSRDQVRAIAKMPLPRTKKEMQQLTRRLVALDHFISRYSNRCQPFFKVI